MLCIRDTSHGPVSVTSRSSTKTAERIGLLNCVKRKFGYVQNKGTSLGNYVLNSGLRKCRHGIDLSIVETCYQLSSRKVDAQTVINWAVVDQLSR